MRKSLGAKSHELTKEQIAKITQTYLDFEESEVSKIFPNEDFGYQKITVERPLRLSAQLSQQTIERLRFHKSLYDEMEWIYGRFGEEVYQDLAPHKAMILKHFEDQGTKIKTADQKKLLNPAFWQGQRKLLEVALGLQDSIGTTVLHDFNVFKKQVDKALKTAGIKLSASDKKMLLDAVSWKNEEAEKVIKKKDKEGNVSYEPDSELRDTEQVPLQENIDVYFQREVKPHVPDAWVDYDKTVIGYEISFTKYFYQYEPLRSLEEITQDLLAIEKESDGLLKELLA